MQPGGILAVLNDLDAACDRTAYEHWYQTDHMPDRLAVPGFLHARRYRRVEGQGPEDAQEYFTFYETAGADVLRSPAYRARLAAPTPGTVEMMRHFRAMCRSICTVASDAGSGTAGLAAVIGSPTATPHRPDLTPHLAPHLAHGSVTRLRLWTQAEDLPDNPETTLRPGTDTRLGTILVAEGTMAAPVLAAARAAATTCGLTAAPTLYALLFASPPASPESRPA